MMKYRRHPTTETHHPGFTLVEFLVAMLMGAVLLTGLVQIAAGARSSFRLQEALAEMQESGRFASDTLGGILRQSTYTARPWSGTGETAGLTADSADGVSLDGDRLAVRTWSERNCFGSFNPVTGATGQPEIFLRESILELNGAGNLAHTCRYGASVAEFVTQFQRQGLMENIDAFQALYAEDLDGDGAADHWVRGGQWLDEQRVVGLQIALLLSSTQAVREPVSQSYELLDHVVKVPADGKLRRAITYVQAFRDRIR